MAIKVLIVEDEMIIRQGIISLINWNKLDCQVVDSCENPIEALKLLSSKKIDLVITDIKMPHMNGLDFAKILKEDYPDIGVIILTAYKDFEYAQKAIELNVLSYALKTNFLQDLPLSIEKCKSKLIKKNSKKIQSVDIKKLNSFFIQSINNGVQNNDISIKDWIDLNEFVLNNYYVMISEILVEELNQDTSSTNNFDKSTENFISLSLQDISHLTVRLSKNIIVSIISFDSENEVENLNKLLTKCNEILSVVSDFMNFNINLSISKQHHNINEFKKAYKESKLALQNISSIHEISIYDSLLINNNDLNISIISNNLSEYIIKKDINSIQLECKKLFILFKENTVSAEIIRFKLINIVSSCLHYVSSNFIKVENYSNLQKDFFNTLLSLGSNFSLEMLLFNTLTTIVKNQTSSQSSFNSVVLLANTYIEKNYRSCIKLDDIAQFTNISSSYLSRLYKQETGTTLSTYINKFRIDKAKFLFSTTKKNISEVAYEVGFQDPAYFTNIFIKFEGKSPRNYCKHLQYKNPNM